MADAKIFESETEDVKAMTAEQLRFGSFVANAEEKLLHSQSIIAKFQSELIELNEKLTEQKLN